MKLNIGDVVKCPPSGIHAGPRIGKIKAMTKRVDGTFGAPVLIKYIDYPESNDAWVHPIKNVSAKLGKL